MKIHEYQARTLLEKFGVPTNASILVDTPDQAFNAFAKLGCKLGVVKAQVHAGGRGKGGGVKLARSAEDARTHAGNILSKQLITPQTGPAGVKVRKLLVVDGVDIAKEFYVGLLVDRSRDKGCPVLMASAEGGVEIEEVAAKNPDAIIKEWVDPEAGLRDHQARNLAYKLGFKGKQVGQAVKIFKALTKLFIECDCSLAEINPLVLTPATQADPDGKVVAIDAKVTFDDNALFRHPDLEAMIDVHEEDPAEIRAKKFNLSYISLDGSIGCLVNGAGLAMSTMDLIKLHGAEPANFLDVGGSATKEAVAEAFSIILGDPKVKGVLVNIFGGIAKCDLIAQAIIDAAKTIGFKVPLVVRLEGTNVDAARKLLDAARPGLPTLQTATDLTDAAKKITKAIAA